MICKNCGSEVSEDETICKNCGAVIKNENISDNESVINHEPISDSETDFDENIFNGEKTFDSKNISEDENVTDKENIFEKEFSLDNENSDIPELSDEYSSIEKKSKKTKNIVRSLFIGVVVIVILGGVFGVAMNIYNNSPERIFEKVKQSNSYKKYIEENGYTVKGYYFVDLINNDGVKEIVLEVSDKTQGMEKIVGYIGLKENGEYKIGKFNGIGGTFIASIDMFKNINESKGLFVCLKTIDEISQEDIEAIKTQTGIGTDEDAKKLIENMYGVGIEQYALFNMIDYVFENYGEVNASKNGCDFVLGFNPEKILGKSNNSETGETEYHYIDVNSDDFQNQGASDKEPDYSISEEEFNNYVNEFKSDKEPVEYFSVSAN